MIVQFRNTQTKIEIKQTDNLIAVTQYFLAMQLKDTKQLLKCKNCVLSSHVPFSHTV